MLAHCSDCGSMFPRAAGEGWKLRCLPCWRAMRTQREAAPVPAVTATPIEPARVRQLIQLCHPDRHGGSPLAHDVTAWLLGLRREAAR